MKCELWYVSKAKKDLYKLDKAIRIQIFKKLENLKDNFELGKFLSNSLKNKRSLHVGNYRIIYTTKGNQIYILKVGPRKTIYGEYTYELDDSEEVYNHMIRSRKKKIIYNVKQEPKITMVNTREFSNNIDDDTEEDKKMILTVLQDIDKRNAKSYTEEEFLKLNPDLKKYTLKKKINNARKK